MSNRMSGEDGAEMVFRSVASLLGHKVRLTFGCRSVLCASPEQRYVCACFCVFPTNLDVSQLFSMHAVELCLYVIITLRNINNPFLFHMPASRTCVNACLILH